VDYESSDESEPEEMDVEPGGGAREAEACSSEKSARPPISGVCHLRTEDGQLASAVDTFSSQNSRADLGFQPRMDSSSRKEVSRQGTGERLGLFGPTEDKNVSPPQDLANHTVTCLSELRALLARLHRRNLFPYNPTSLLKLLTSILLTLSPSSNY